MRPQELVPIFKNISSLPGIGPKLEKVFNKLVGDKIIDLLWHIPYGILKRNKIDELSKSKINSIIIIKLKVLKHNPSRFRRQPYKVNCISKNDILDIIFFNANHPYIKNNFPVNEEIYVSGKLEFYKNKYQITHPDYILKPKEIKDLTNIQPIYSLTKGLTQKTIYKTIKKTLENIPDFKEWIDEKTMQNYKFLSWKNSIEKIHKPINENDILNNNIYRKRLAYDELLAHQLAIGIIRKFNKRKSGIQFNKCDIQLNELIAKLPFHLTDSQYLVIKEIYKDLLSTNSMIRLLQGDVGSGKTIVSIIGMFISYQSGYQSAIMAPTEILANQHYETINNFLKKYKIHIILLNSKDKGKIRKQKISDILIGKANIIVGTHSLIQEDVKFKNLGIVIIDEQHRFGVHQRLAFTYKGLKPNVLVMTATPIPRTLTLATYGDIDESRILEKPKGRLEILTTAISINKIDKLINALKNKINNNEKIYWVCPLIEESEDLDLQAATERYKILSKIFKNKTLLIHGQLKSKEKEDVMNKFKNENFNILIATTVIEVGIDIPEATTLIIEHAERFGLSQLHQLRGRVGRNNLQSNCLLIYKNHITKNAKKRIKIMKKTNDGFKIAEQDLKIRGPGEILGKKQSGQPNFKIADLSFDQEILNNVVLETNKLINDSNILKTDRGNMLKLLLYLFEKDIAIKTLMSG